jgi:hypothetical protein
VSGAGGAPVPTQAIWNWNTAPLASGQPPVAVGYPPGGAGQPTKTGLTPTDLQNLVVIPIQTYGSNPVPIPTAVQIQWIRWAEDEVERETSIRLCQTWIAAQPTWTPPQTQAVGLTVSGQYQQLGVDYDLYEPPYDFIFNRAQDEGWVITKLRWRPIKLAMPGGFNSSALSGNTAVRNFSYIYPLLNEYFRVPSSWLVEDQNYGLIRLVPSTNVQMLPLFAMQLAFMGFAESVPGGIWLQYIAGLTANDYNSEYSFMRQLVLLKAAIQALMSIQLTVNWGAIETTTNVDGLMYRSRYAEGGPFIGQIKAFEDQAKRLMKLAKSKVQGPVFGVV